MNYDNAKETLKGTIENVVYRNEENDYTVLEIVTESEDIFTAVGMIPMAFEGENVVLTGRWVYHKEFGKQFNFDSYEKTLPKEIDGILQYLSSGTIKGVGPVTALKIVNRFGLETFDVIENHPEWLADIPGITRKKAALISESFRQQSDLRGVMIFCKDYIGTGEATKVYKKLGAGAVGIIKENPYILCENEYGISFEKVDEFAKTLGISLAAPVRILSGLKYILSYNATVNGHTCLPREKLIEATSSLLEISIDAVADNLEKFLRSGEMSNYITSRDDFIMKNEINKAEKYIAERIVEINRGVISFSVTDVSVMLEKLEAELGIKYARLQKEAIYEALTSGVTILTGGPGTGKTTVVKALLSIFNSLGMETVLAAPTGRAAKRMSEATSAEAKTIHRMLEMERTSELETRFGRNQRAPLDESVIIIDEASMIDVTLAEALFAAVKRSARIVLIGDADQLPSVGAGNIFDDLIKSGKIKTVRLTEIFRQSRESLIITNAHRINDGEAPILTNTDNDFFFVRREYERDISDTVADLVTKRLPKKYGSSIVGDIQVITPSKKGAGGIEILNATLQLRMNPPAKFKKEKAAHGVVFREGDKVMQTANNYELEWTRGGYSGTGVYNGDIGVIESINNQNSNMTIRFDERVVEYPFDQLDELELAYAITVHKSQGSEYPVVIIPMYNCAPMLMTRNLLYTAITRARRMVILVGRSDIPSKMVENNRVVMRYTTLRERLINY